MSAVIEALPLAQPETPFRRLAREFFRSPVATGAFAMLMVIVALALLRPAALAAKSPTTSPRSPVMDARLDRAQTGSAGFNMWLGADGAGRDMWSAMLYGLRISLGVGAASGVVALAIGTAVGLLAAYRGGWLDALIMRVVDLQLSFPAILVALILVAILGRGADKVMIALILVQWAYYARTVRGSALVERRKEYIEAAQCLDLPPRRIVFRHLLPNVIAPMIVVGTLQTAHAISLEATLSFLGVGLPLTEPSLGLLIANGFEYMLSGKYWISFYPGLALLATIMSINLSADRLRDVLNPRLER
jgi:peptide/nickel transport system permease protein